MVYKLIWHQNRFTYPSNLYPFETLLWNAHFQVGPRVYWRLLCRAVTNRQVGYVRVCMCVEHSRPCQCQQHSQGMLSSPGYRCHSTHSRRGGFVLRYQHHDVAAEAVTSHQKKLCCYCRRRGVWCYVMLCFVFTNTFWHSFTLILIWDGLLTDWRWRGLK